MPLKTHLSQDKCYSIHYMHKLHFSEFKKYNYNVNLDNRNECHVTDSCILKNTTQIISIKFRRTTV